jgi:hypothetical protein
MALRGAPRIRARASPRSGQARRPCRRDGGRATGSPADRASRRGGPRSAGRSTRCVVAGGTIAAWGLVPCSGTRWSAMDGHAGDDGSGPCGGVEDPGRSRCAPPGGVAVGWRPSIRQDSAAHALEGRTPKAVGEPSAGTPPGRFAGAGGGHQDLGPPRHSLTLPPDWHSASAPCQQVMPGVDMICLATACAKRRSWWHK